MAAVEYLKPDRLQLLETQRSPCRGAGAKVRGRRGYVLPRAGDHTNARSCCPIALS